MAISHIYKKHMPLTSYNDGDILYAAILYSAYKPYAINTCRDGILYIANSIFCI